MTHECTKWKQLTKFKEDSLQIDIEGGVTAYHYGESGYGQPHLFFKYCPYCGEKLDGKIICPYCREEFKDATLINLHLARYHSIQLDNN